MTALQIWHFLRKSCESTWPNALNLIWGLLEHFQMLDCPLHDVWLLVKGVPYFAKGHQSTCSFRVQFGMRHQGNDASSCCTPLLDPPLQRGWRTTDSENFRVMHYGPKELKMVWALLEHVWMLSCARHGHGPPVMNAQELLLVLAIDT